MGHVGAEHVSTMHVSTVVQVTTTKHACLIACMHACMHGCVHADRHGHRHPFTQPVYIRTRYLPEVLRALAEGLLAVRAYPLFFSGDIHVLEKSLSILDS